MQPPKTQISTSVKKVESAHKQAVFVELHAELTKLFSKQVTAQSGRPVRFWARAAVARTVRTARNCMLMGGGWVERVKK